METSGGGAADAYLRKDEEPDGFYDPEHLPPLLEDEENVSLADLLSLRDSCLCEEEVWAVCAECVLALQSIRPSHLFYTLCITPDTLAFNAHGNVSFMEQLSDDPEGSFVPPEFDSTGSTFEDIKSLADTHLSYTSSAAVCRKLSSVGRRVLSIESVSNTQDGQEDSWEARWQHSKAKSPLKRLNSDDRTREPAGSSVTNTLSRQQVCRGWDSSLWAEDMEVGEADALILVHEVDCCSHNSCPVRSKPQQRFSRTKGILNRSCSVPDSNNPPCLSTPPHGDISIPVYDLTEIGADEHLKWSNKLPRLNRGKSCEFYPYCCTQDREESPVGNEDVDHFHESSENQSNGSIQEPPPSFSPCQEAELDQNSCEGQSMQNKSLYVPFNYMTKSMQCLNEEFQDEWISLRELLTRCGRRLMLNELWALCYSCLDSLQTYIDFPAYLCLDTVYVNCKGEVLFLKPKNIETLDDFYLAPEYQEHGIVTEKVCVYGVAAILWTTAKFNLSPNQKLALPRKMKRLLLEMAKKTPIERPTIVMAKKSCLDNLSHQGLSAELVWTDLISRIHPPALNSGEVEDCSTTEVHLCPCEEHAPNSSAVRRMTSSG